MATGTDRLNIQDSFGYADFAAENYYGAFDSRDIPGDTKIQKARYALKMAVEYAEKCGVILPDIKLRSFDQIRQSASDLLKAIYVWGKENHTDVMCGQCTYCGHTHCKCNETIDVSEEILAKARATMEFETTSGLAIRLENNSVLICGPSDNRWVDLSEIEDEIAHEEILSEILEAISAAASK